jgi:hypothetical protein
MTKAKNLAAAIHARSIARHLRGAPEAGGRVTKLGAVLACVLATSFGASCRSSSEARVRDDIGSITGDVADAPLYLEIARAVLDGAAPPPSRRDAPGRRVFLVLWRPYAAPVFATANGGTLRDSVVQAAREVASKAGGGSGGRLELDVTRAATPTTLADEGRREADRVVAGTEGLLVVRDAKTGFVLPGEVVQRGFFHGGEKPRVDWDGILRLAGERAETPARNLPSMRAYRIATDSFVESAERDRIVPVVRGRVADDAPATADGLLSAVRRGADYLARVMDSGGRYIYRYEAAVDHIEGEYGWLRHAGATYALLEAYEEFGTPLYREKAELGLQALKARLTEDPPSHGLYLSDLHNQEQEKVGGAGLSLIAFAKHAAVTGVTSDFETMRALARFIVAGQQNDGHFRANRDLEPAEHRKAEPIYYQGEGTLALLRMFALDRDPQLLEAAQRSADWTIHTRDAPLPDNRLEADHWMSYALNELFRLTANPAYLEHAERIARSILSQQYRADHTPAPDWVGLFPGLNTTPATTRLEAYAADVAALRFAGKADQWLLDGAKEVAGATLRQQFGPDNSYWLPHPAQADGGVRAGIWSSDVRIDYVQHAMSAWLHLARELRDPTYGRSGVPCQDPTVVFADLPTLPAKASPSNAARRASGRDAM